MSDDLVKRLRPEGWADAVNLARNVRGIERTVTNTGVAVLCAAVLGADAKQQETADRIESQQAEIERLRSFVSFVIRGCESGLIKSQPIITDDPNAAQLEMRSLAQVAKAALQSQQATK